MKSKSPKRGLWRGWVSASLKNQLLIMVFLAPFIAYSQMADTSVTREEYELLKRRLDSLEVKYEQIQISLIEKEPIFSGRHLGSRRGFTWSLNKSVFRMSLDGGYSFSTTKYMRIALMIGHAADFGRDHDLPYWEWYGKVAYGTPVLLNMLSFNSYLKTIYYDPASRENYHTSGGFGIGGEIEFWLSKRSCLTLGNDITMTMKRPSGMAPQSYRFTQVNLGFKQYFQSRKKR